jgi:hypothetical protein
MPLSKNRIILDSSDALAWFLVNDRAKLLAYQIFDPVKARQPSDDTPQIAQRADLLYEQHGRHDGHAAQDWAQDEREIRKDLSHR